MRNVLKALLASGALLAAAGAANAGTAPTNFNVSVTILANCLVSATNMAFPNYAPGAGNLTPTSTVTVNCTNGTPFTVKLNAGSTSGGTFANRLMTDGASPTPHTVQYNLFTASNLATVWGDGTGTTGTVAGNGTGILSGIAETVYGQLVDGGTNQTAPPGTYNDTIGVTVAF